MYAEIYSAEGEHDAALRLLAGFASVSAELHRLVILCRRDGVLPPGSFDAGLFAREPVLTSAPITNLTGLTRLVLDGVCRVDQSELLRLLNFAIDKPMTFERRRIGLMIYAAHLQWRIGDQERAIGTLEAAYRLLPDEPLPLFLATEWLSDIGARDRAHTMFARAVEVGRRSRKDYTAMERAVAELIRGDNPDPPTSARELAD